jgi:DNA-binding response OmpR family regulator
MNPSTVLIGIDLAWGERQEGVGSNVVDVVILSLRRKLDRHSGSIQTVRGSGYILRN